MTALAVNVGKVDIDPFDIFTDRRYSRAATIMEDALRSITVDEEIVEAAIRRRAPSLAATAVELGPMADIIGDEFAGVLRAEYMAAAIDEADGGAVIVRKADATATLSFAFDVTNPAAIRWAKENAAELVVEINSSTRASIRSLIETALREGGHPYDVARQIKPLIGLHSRWANAVLRHRNEMTAAGLPQASIERSTARYYDRLLRARTKNIARTEIMRAANQGRYASWLQADDAGLLPKGTQKQWLAAGGAEQICADTDGQIVGLYESFSNAFGSFQMPPCHPSCRCTSILIMPERPTAQPREPKPTTPEPSRAGPRAEFDRAMLDDAEEFLTRGETAGNQVVRANAKDKLVTDIANRIMARPDFDDIWSRRVQGRSVASVETRIEKQVYDYVDDLVRNWTHTSGDGSPDAWALQRAVHEEMGTLWSDYAAKTVSQLSTRKLSTAGARSAAEVYEELTTEGMDLLRAFVREMYLNTQDELAKAGIKEVTLARGAGIEYFTTAFTPDELAAFGELRGGVPVPIGMSPASSWSTNVRTAIDFAKGHAYDVINGDAVLFQTTVPAESVLSTARTGWGCLPEYEWVLLGDRGNALVLNAETAWI